MSAIVLDVGIHDIPADTYHNDPAPEPSLSAGFAHTMLAGSPLHAWTGSARLNPFFKPTTKDAFDIGSVAHELLLGKGKGAHVIEADSYRKKAAQEECDEARGLGYVPLLREQYDRVEAMMEAAKYQLAAHGVGNPFERGRAANTNELTLIWRQDGVYNRAMADCLDMEARIVYDFKTSGEYAHAEAWCQRSMGYGIDLRTAHYLEAVETLLPGKPWTLRYVVQEKAAPHCLSVIELSPTTIALGQRKLERARQMFRHCLDSNTWPGLSRGIAVVEPRSYFEADWMAREEREEAFRQKHGKDVLEAWFQFQAPEAAAAAE